MSNFDPKETAERIQARRRYIEILKKDQEKVKENLRSALEQIQRQIKDD